MAVETFTDAVVVDGSQDITQLRVQAHSTQNQPLQTWENSAGAVLARLNKDGRLELGDVTITSTPNALIEADQPITSASATKQGVQSRGIVSGAMSEALAWSVHELEFKDAGGVSSAQKALRGKLIHANTGSGVSADLRGGDFEVENQTGSSEQKVGQATGMQGRVTNDSGIGAAYLHQAAAVRGEIVNGSGDTLDEAVAFEVAPPSNAGTIGQLYGLRIPDLILGGVNYAIKTGLGSVQFGDFVGIGTVPSSQLHVAQESSLLNPILENAVSVAEGNKLSFRRTRGTLASKTLVNNGDYAGRLSFEAWDGSTYQSLASIEAIVAATPGANDMPGQLVFSTTPDGSSTPVPALTIHADGSTDLTITDFTDSTHNHQNAAGGGTLNAAAIGSGTLALARGGTNADLSATGGTGKVLKQSTVGGAITVATLSASEIPSLDAAAIGTGTFDAARIPTLDASKIGSGVLNNARVNWASPSAIGNTTPSTGLFTALTANSQLGVTGSAGTARPLYFLTDSSPRWLIYANYYAESGSNAGSDLHIARYSDGGGSLGDALVIDRSDGTVYAVNNLHVYGTLSKAGGSFLIDHPLDPMNRNLIHSFVEAPRPDLIYRGKVQLISGKAQVSIDAANNMTEGTFEALTHHAEAEVFVQNKTGWANVRGEVIGNVLHIECQDPASSDTIAWLVVAERADAFMQACELTDADGRFIVEADKSVPTPEDLQALEPRYDAAVETVQTEVVTSLNGKRGYPIHPAVYGMALPTREVRPIDA